MVELSSQNDLLRILPQLYDDLSIKCLDTLSDYKVSYLFDVPELTSTVEKHVLGLIQWFSTGGILYFQGGNYQWFPTGGPQSDFWGSMSLFMEKMKEYIIVKAVVDIRGGELGSCLGK